MINQDYSGFENMFSRPSGKVNEEGVVPLRTNNMHVKSDANNHGANMMLNFDYSSIFDNKEALHNNSILSGAHGGNQICSGLDSG